MSAGAMSLDVRTIPIAGLERRWTCSAEELNLDSDVAELHDTAVVAVHITRNGREVRALGEVRARLGQTCGRCLEPFEQDATLPVEVMYFPVEDRAAAQREADAQAAVGVAWYDGAHINLQPEVRDVVLLSLPMTPRCRPECKGLCAQCGVNLNAGPCACLAEPSSSPFAALGDLKAKLAADAAAEHEDD